ncbi:hypothetical protein RUND412_005182 [Rhizina undulata]
MPPAQPAAMKSIIDPSKAAEYSISIGESLKRVNLNEAPVYTSVKYNFKPPSTLANTIPGKLTPAPRPSSPPFTLMLTPSGNSDSKPAKEIAYTGAQHPAKKTECLLLYNPTTQEFVLEKLDSTFTFNAKVFENAHPPLPLEREESEDEAASPVEKDDTNPFDYRHFLNRKSEKASRAEEKAKKESRRREALKRAVKNLPEEEEEEEEEDEEDGMVFPDINVRARTGGKSIAREAESEESDEDADDSDEEIADTGYHQAVAPRRPLVDRAVNRHHVPDEDLEEIVLPDIAAATAQMNSDDEEISDVDESDDDQPAARQQQSQVQQEEEEDEDIFDLAQELERELESGDDALNMDMDAGSSALVVEGDDVPRPVGLGIGVQGGPMMSLRQMMGGGGEDESESEEE